MRAFQFAPQLSWGLLENVDLILRPTWSSLRGVDAAGGGHEQGIGDTTFDVKWRFVEFDALSFGVRAGVDAPTGAVAKSLGAGKPSAHAQLIATLDAAPFTFDVNANYTRNPLPDERRDLYGFALAMVWSATERLRLTAEAAAFTNPLAGHSTWPAVARVGAIATVTVVARSRRRLPDAAQSRGAADRRAGGRHGALVGRTRGAALPRRPPSRAAFLIRRRPAVLLNERFQSLADRFATPALEQ